MTESSAEKFANVVIGAAAVAGACIVLTTPQLRRAAWRFAVASLTGTIPAWLSQEVKNSWEASGQIDDAYRTRS